MVVDGVLWCDEGGSRCAVDVWLDLLGVWLRGTESCGVLGPGTASYGVLLLDMLSGDALEAFTD